MNIPRNVTMVDDLPDLSDLENTTYSEGVDRQSVMSSIQQKRPVFYSPPQESGMIQSNSPNEGDEVNVNIQQQGGNMYYNPALNIPCIEIANHIRDCPICSRFYSNDRTIYIIVIVILSIIVIILLKKVLNV